jgi:ketosteroid isomerase-like protein
MIARTLVFFALGPGVCFSQPATLPAQQLGSAAECAVHARESSFAASVERRDEKAFAEHIHPGAVFLGAGAPARGRDAVVASWSRIVRGDGVRLRWRAGDVVIGGDPSIAYSTGPSYFESLAPVDPAKPRPRYTLNNFFSVWVKDRDGRWRVMYDGGVAGRGTDDFAEVERHLRSGRTRCP